MAAPLSTWQEGVGVTAPAVPPRARDRLVLWLLVSGLAVIVAAYQHSLLYLWWVWARPEYSHSYIIPPIAALIACHRLSQDRLRPSPSWGGLALMLVGSGLMAIGQLASFNPGALYGFLLSISGLFCAAFGRRALRVILPAIVYLACAIPLPDAVFIDLSARLQLLSSSLAFVILDFLGVPVYVDGNVIDLGGYQLEVAEACSGLRYLFPLISFGYLIAYLFEAAWWKRAIIFLSAVPLAILMNSLRIAFIGVTVDLWGSAMAEGMLHSFEGWSVFILCTLIMFAEVWILNRVGRAGHLRLEFLMPIRGPFFSAAPRLSLQVIGANAIALVALGISHWIALPSTVVASHRPLSGLPLLVGSWQGIPSPLSADVIKVLGFTDYASIDFTAPAEPAPINFYVAYYAHQSVGSAVHSPANCIPGGGWTIRSHTIATVQVGLESAASIQLNRLVIERHGQQELVYYWFDQRGRDLTSEWSVKWYLLHDAVTSGRSDGSLIRLVTPIGTGTAPIKGDPDRLLADFLRLMLPNLAGST